jgi:hypothetical protein
MGCPRFQDSKLTACFEVKKKTAQFLGAVASTFDHRRVCSTPAHAGPPVRLPWLTTTELRYRSLALATSPSLSQNVGRKLNYGEKPCFVFVAWYSHLYHAVMYAPFSELSISTKAVIVTYMVAELVVMVYSSSIRDSSENQMVRPDPH